MTEQTIVVEGLPEGWRVKIMTICPRHRKDDKFKAEAILELEKIKPREIRLVETEEFRKVKCNEYYFDMKGNIAFWSSKGESIEKYNIVREVKETDSPLTNEEPKLSLSVDELRDACSRVWPDYLVAKVDEFIKENS